MEQGQDPRQQFLDMLKGGGSSSGAAPPPPGASSPEPPVTDRPAEEAPPTGPLPPEAPPLTFEQQPPPAEEVPAAMAALAADEPASSPPPVAGAGPDLMDLGYDSQVQGTVLGLHSIGMRLAVVAEGLKLIPILAGVARDLERLNYTEVAQAVAALNEWVQGEEAALKGDLEQRTQARQGQPPAQ